MAGKLSSGLFSGTAEKDKPRGEIPRRCSGLLPGSLGNGPSHDTWPCLSDLGYLAMTPTWRLMLCHCCLAQGQKKAICGGWISGPSHGTAPGTYVPAVLFCFSCLSPLGMEQSWHSLHVFGNRLLCTIAIGLSVLAWPHTWGSVLVSGSLKVSLLIQGYHLRPLLQEWRRGRIYLVYHPEVEADVLVPSQNSYVTKPNAAASHSGCTLQSPGGLRWNPDTPDILI